MLCTVPGYAARKPSELPYARRPRCVLTAAPSEFVMRVESTAIAAASHAIAMSHARSGVISQGCDRSSPGTSLARSAASGSPAHGSSAVYFAIVQALATVSRSAAAPRSPVLALPLRVPKYTVTPMPRSRWYSIVSTSPRRALTLRPTSMLMAASAWLAPRLRASASASSTSASRSAPSAVSIGEWSLGATVVLIVRQRP